MANEPLRSILGYDEDVMLPDPADAIEDADLAQLAELYSGIEAEAPAPQIIRVFISGGAWSDEFDAEEERQRKRRREEEALLLLLAEEV